MRLAETIALRRRRARLRRFDDVEAVMLARNNSEIPGYTAKRAEIASPEYRKRVAAPVMNAVDAMPAVYRELVNEFGYVDVYRAWRKGWTPKEIRGRVRNGRFAL
jgi:hypothetical protein